jgi:hypothetical protein
MPFHRCTICLDDGNVMAKDVSVSLQEPSPGDEAEWHGTLTITHQLGLQAGQRYQLILDDGRRGTFLVRRNTFAGDVNRAVAIHGMGPLA